MARIRSRFGQAAATHRRAAALVTAADAALTGYVPRPRLPAEPDDLYELARRLSAAASQLVPGWLGAPLAGDPPEPLAEQAVPAFVRLGTALLPGGAEFPVIVPWQHLAFDAAPEDPRVPAVLQALLLRLVAAAPPGTLQVRMVDPAGSVAAPFAALQEAGVMAAPATDAAGLAAILDEVEQLRPVPERQLLVIVAGWPDGCGPEPAARLAALAARSGGPRLLVGQWPPPAADRPPLPGSTQVTLFATHAQVGHPPGGSFAAGAPPGVEPTAGLHAEVQLDPAPPPGWIERVCARLAGPAPAPLRVTLADLLPEGPLWAEEAGDGLAVPVGRASGPPVTLRFGPPTWHWLVGGRGGSGKTALLHGVLYGLASRYPPDQLAVYLLDPTGSDAYLELARVLPHVRAAGLGTANRVRAALHEVAAQAQQRGGPRVLCVVDGLHRLRDAQAHELLGSLAATDGQRGVHLLLAGEDSPPEPLAARCRVRIALPGARVLDPANAAAARIPLGTAVVNTASGLGGPRGATRAHEQLVHFPDPYADPAALAGLRQRLAGQERS